MGSTCYDYFVTLNLTIVEEIRHCFCNNLQDIKSEFQILSDLNVVQKKNDK